MKGEDRGRRRSLGQVIRQGSGGTPGAGAGQDECPQTPLGHCPARAPYVACCSAFKQRSCSQHWTPTPIHAAAGPLNWLVTFAAL